MGESLAKDIIDPINIDNVMIIRKMVLNTIEFMNTSKLTKSEYIMDINREMLNNTPPIFFIINILL